MRKYALLILLLSSILSISQNCNNTLSGRVTDLHDGSLLIGATLIIAGSEQAVITDLDGKFILKNLCNDTYSIQVSHSFCLTRGFTIKVSGNTTKNFKLEHHLEELNQVTVEGKVYSKKSRTIPESTISKEEL